jgi:release factor glutamine methyltransferase
LLVSGGTAVLAHSSLTGIDRTRADLTARGYACRVALVVEMDLPLRGYARYRPHLLTRLYESRRTGLAEFRGLRFEVHVLIATRATTKGVM